MLRHVSIQGFQGSFHEVAARRYFGPQPAVPLTTCATTAPKVLQGNNAGCGPKYRRAATSWKLP